MTVGLGRVCGVVGLALIMIACADTVEGKPTAAPSLKVSLWMTYPAVQTGQTQSANLVVYDLQSQPVTAATGVLVIAVGDYQQEYHFPLTNSEGRANVEIVVPPNAVQQRVAVQVIVVQSASGQWGEATAEFEVIP